MSGLVRNSRRHILSCHGSHVFEKTGLGSQCRPRSVCPAAVVLSGSILFAILSASFGSFTLFTVQTLGWLQQLSVGLNFPDFYSTIILTVSSEQIAVSWEPNIIAVNIPNKRPSNTRNIKNIVVAGGDTPEQPAMDNNNSGNTCWMIAMILNMNTIYKCHILMLALK